MYVQIDKTLWEIWIKLQKITNTSTELDKNKNFNYYQMYIA